MDVAGPSGNTTPPDHFTPPPSSPAVCVESPSNSERIGAMHALEALPPLEDVGGPLPDELVPDEDITIAHVFTRVFHVAKDSKSVSKTPGLDEHRLSLSDTGHALSGTSIRLECSGSIAIDHP